MSGEATEAVNRPKANSSGSLEPNPAGNSLLYVVGSLDVGGTERHLALLAPRLKRFGWNPAIYCLTQPGQQASQLAQAGVYIIPPPFAFAPKDGWLPVRSSKILLSALKLFWIMIRTRPQVTHFFLPGAYLIGGPLALVARVPRCVMSRRSLNCYQKNHAIMAFVERWLHRRMTAVLGNSRRVVQELVELEHCPSDRVALIYNGIDVSAFDTRRQAPSTIESEPISDQPVALITVANLIAYKGHGDLIDALAGIADSLPPKWSILFVGHDQGIGTRLMKQVRILGLEENVKFLGSRSDVVSLLAAADIGVLCSHEEGFSNSILEGMAAGLPMIVTDVGGNAEAVIHGVTGLVVPPRNAKALGAAILELALDADLRRAMGEAGRERVEKCFGIDRCVTNYARLYAGLVRGELPAEIELEATPV